MRKTLSTIALSLGLVFSGAPAFAVGDDPIVYCDDAPAEGPAGCVPTECHDTVTRFAGALASTRQMLAEERATVQQQRATIAKKSAKIRQLRAEVRRLKSR